MVHKPLSPPSVSGFHSLALLGIGGFATVYRAVDASGGAVALKVFHDHEDRQRLAGRAEREAQVLSLVADHPHAQQLLARTETGRTETGQLLPVLVLELHRRLVIGAQGSDDNVSSAQQGLGSDPVRPDPVRSDPVRPDPVRAVQAGVRLGGALAALHARGFVHADVRVDNVLLDERGDPVLCDFGSAQPIDPKVPWSESGQVWLAGDRFSAPELHLGARPSVSADVYGLGAVIAQLAGGDEMESLRNLPSALREVLLNALDERSEQRPLDMAEFVNALCALSPLH